MQTTFSIIFYPRGNDVDKNGNAPIYLRITVNGKRSELSIKKKIPISKWNSEAGKVRGTRQEVRELNRYMDTIKNKVNRIYDQLLEKETFVSADIIKNIYSGKSKKHKMILVLFQEHNDKVESLIGKDFAPGTAERYKTAKKHVSDYILQEYKVVDIPIKDVDHIFISGFEYYLKTTRKCGHNTAIKYVTNFKKIIRIAYANGWIEKDPFINWNSKLKIIDREFLTQEEIQLLHDKSFSMERLEQVKDVFLFSCFTGLAYADVKKLTPKDVVIGMDSERWIKTNRTKTKIKSNVPLLPIAISILNKYLFNVKNQESRLLPVQSNQKTNAYLKEIADLCGIDKNLTFHLARHTFATTVTLSNGVPIESVSKMLGHTTLRATQHYAKILDRKVSEDMLALRSRLVGSN